MKMRGIEGTACAAQAQGGAAGTRAKQLTRRQACAALGGLALGAASLVLGGCGEDAGQGGTVVAEAVPEEAVIADSTGTGAAANVQSATADAAQASAAATTAVADGETNKQVSASGATCVLRTEDERKATSNSLNEDFPGRHVCFLTFDDGPSTNTQRILGILDDYGVKATWFVKGNCGSLEELPGIWAAGNQVAIHTYSHDYEAVYASNDAYWADLHQCGDVISEQIGFAPTLVRFPGGSVNDFNAAVRSQIIDQMNTTGYHYFDWNVSCGDGSDHAADDLVNYTISEADGCNSCCVLMHDSAAKDTTVEALPRIIQYFIDNDFEFDVLLSDTFGYHF